MAAGRSAPRYAMMALLYPRSKSLQSHLSEYFIVVVHLCHQVLKFTQKSTLGQFVSTLSDSDVKMYQSELDRWANMIKDEVNLLEAQENSRFRALSSKFSESFSHQQKMKENLRVLGLCSTYDHETTWKQTRKIGNTTLCNRTAEYQDWKGQPDSGTLICTGKLGSGKSVLLANIVDDLNLSGQSQTVAYFFCRHDIPESLKARTVIGSLARQLLRPISGLAEFIDGTAPALHGEELFSLLQCALPHTHKAYFILDGLDECDSAERQILIQQLRRLQKSFIMLLCVSLRVEPGNTLKLSLENFTAARIASIPDDNPDIAAFIDAELGNCIESKNLLIGNPTLILEIQDALLKRSQGMFLWVALQIKSLCDMETDHAIRQALADLPKDLSETFSRILHKSDRIGKPHQRLILELVIAAQRPLTTGELREALSVVPGDIVWRPERLINDIYSTLSCCGSLITVDEEELTVRLVHHSVKQFLLSGFKDLTNAAFTIDGAMKKMADIIVTYMSYGVFETRVSTMGIPQIRARSVPSRIIHSTRDSSSHLQRLALKLLKCRTRPDFDIGKLLAETSNMYNPSLVDDFHFYAYATSHWPKHVFRISEGEPAVYNLLVRLLTGDSLDKDTTDAEGRTPLWWAAKNGQAAIVKLLLDSDKVDRQKTLWYAARNGHEAVVKLLLDSGEVDGQLTLYHAACIGHVAVVKLLLGSGKVDPDPKDGWGFTPLSLAASLGHEAVVKLLLDSGKVNPNSKNGNGQTMLECAKRRGHKGIVKLMELQQHSMTYRA